MREHGQPQVPIQRESIALYPLLMRLTFDDRLVGLWHWGSQVVKKNDDPHQRPHTLRVVNVAGFGLFVAFLLT